MCLTKITSLEKKNFPPKKYGVGYKVVVISSNYKKFQFLWFRKEKPFNKWIVCYKRPTTKITADDGKQYPAGFHIFKEKKDAIRYLEPYIDNDIVVKVYYRRVVAEGYQEDKGCVVAKKMYVVHNENQGESNV